VSTIIVEFDPVRGGFLLQLEPFERSNKKLSICEGLVDVFLSPEQRVLAVESNWGQGGLYIHTLHGAQATLEGRFNAEGPTHDIKGNHLFCLRQDQDSFALWFSEPPKMPGPSFLCLRDGVTRTSLWFSEQWLPLYSPENKPKTTAKSEIIKGNKARSVGGIQLKFSYTAIVYPIEAVEFMLKNVK
jgi:hypothetical protein